LAIESVVNHSNHQVSVSHVGGIAVACLLTSIIVGCHSPSRLGEALSGQVTVEGQPLDEGLITFIPLNDTPGTKVSVTITNGQYEVLPQEGLKAGEFRVEIFGLPPSIKAIAEGLPPPMESKNYREIDAQFNTQSQTTCRLSTGQANVADFAVRYAPPRHR
jgi:hypothetical protein